MSLISSIPREWRLISSRYRLIGTECTKCKTPFFPPRKVCNVCNNVEMRERKFSGKGIIISHTQIHAAPKGFEQHIPYCIGLIKLEEGPVISAQITTNTSISIGSPVNFVFRKIKDGNTDPITYGFKFELIS